MSSAVEPRGTHAGVDALAQDLVVSCARFTRSMARLSTHESSAVWRTLAILDEHGGVRISDLALLNQCSQPTATGMVQRLEAEGDVVRVADPSDRRATLVSLSDGGRAHLRQLRADVSQVLAPRLDALSPTQLGELAGALQTISQLGDLEGALPAEPAPLEVPAPTPSRKVTFT